MKTNKPTHRRQVQSINRYKGTQTSFFSTNFGGKLSFIPVFPFSSAPPLVLQIISLLLPLHQLTVIAVDPWCIKLNAELQQFIPEISQNFLRIPLEEGIGGLNQAQREGEDDRVT